MQNVIKDNVVFYEYKKSNIIERLDEKFRALAKDLEESRKV